MARLKGFKDLTPVDKALQQLFEHLKPTFLEPEVVSLGEALGRVPFEDVVAPRDVPPFDRSAMDGYAVVASDTFGASEFNPKTLGLVGGERLSLGETIRVWTGSPLPEGADAVVMLEYVRESGGRIEVMLPVVPGTNVSPKGEDIKRGEVAARLGWRLRPQDIGLLAALGFSSIKVTRRPKIAIMSTGDELVEPGSRLEPREIIDVNRLILRGMVSELGGFPLDLGISRDELDEITKKISLGLETADIVITTGGTSAGVSDLVPDAVNRLGKPGVLVHGVAMRPGKPTGLAVVNGKPVFLLPGNPVAVMVSFESFARPLILKMLGIEREPRPSLMAKLVRKVPSALGLRVFLRVYVYEREGVYYAEPIRTAGAGILTTVTRANGYVIIPEDCEGLGEGEMVKVSLLGPVGGV